jgi:hypothetical protein
MNTILRWDPMGRTRWNPLKDRNELESHLATCLPVGRRRATVERKP